MNPSQAMNMQGQTNVVYSSTNPYTGGLGGLQPFIEQVIQIIDTKGSFEHVKGLMLETFGGNDIMDMIPSDVEVAAVVGGANPTPASGCCQGNDGLSDNLTVMSKIGPGRFCSSLEIGTHAHHPHSKRHSPHTKHKPTPLASTPYQRCLAVALLSGFP